MQITQAYPEMRTRNLNGRFRQKRSDTHLSTLEDTYGNLSDRRCDAHLGQLRQLRQMSLTAMVKAGPEVTHAPGLSDRQRTQDGRIRQKRSDTLIATLRATYGQSFAGDFAGCITLGKLRELTGCTSLEQLRRY